MRKSIVLFFLVFIGHTILAQLPILYGDEIRFGIEKNIGAEHLPDKLLKYKFAFQKKGKYVDWLMSVSYGRNLNENEIRYDIPSSGDRGNINVSTIIRRFYGQCQFNLDALYSLGVKTRKYAFRFSFGAGLNQTFYRTEYIYSNIQSRNGLTINRLYEGDFEAKSQYGFNVNAQVTWYLNDQFGIVFGKIERHYFDTFRVDEHDIYLMVTRKLYGSQPVLDPRTHKRSKRVKLGSDKKPMIFY